MERKTKRLLSLLLALVMVISMIPATVFADEAEDDPNTEGDVVENEAYIVRDEEEVPFATLEEALEDAAAEEDIFLYATSITLEESVETFGQINVKAGQDITIAGAEGAEITLTRGAGTTASMIHVQNADGAKLTLSNLTVDGNRTSTGSGEPTILAYGDTLTLNNVDIMNGKRSGNGGALYINNGCVVTINGGTYTNNASGGNGGAVYIANGTLNINNASFTSNATTGGSTGGGAIYLAQGTLNVNDATLTGNTAGQQGGAIFAAASTTVNITNATFTENKAQANAGAVIASGSLTVKNSNFTNNVAGMSTGSVGGGAIVANGSASVLRIVGGTFSGNESRYAGGGAITTQSTNAEIRGATFENNLCKNANGGAILPASSGTLTISNTVTFSGNMKSVTFAADGTHSGGSENDIHANNAANVVTVIGTRPDTWVCTQTNGRYTEVEAVAQIGDEPYTTIASAVADAANGTITLLKELTVNATIQITGAVTIEGGGVTLTRAESLTGAMFHIQNVDGAKLTLSNVTLDGHRTDATNTNNSLIFAYGDEMVLNNVNIMNAMRRNAGGAIYVNYGCQVTINGGTYKNNASGVQGGGVVYIADGDLDITDATFTGNSATDGGAIYVVNGNVTTTGTEFTGNTATGLEGRGGNGGAIFVDAGNLDITDAEFTENTAINNGGAIFVDTGALDITDAEFTKNTAINNGGAIYVPNVEMSNAGVAYTGNTADEMGGAVYISSNGAMEILGEVSFSNNTANEAQNDMHVSADASVVVSANIVDMTDVVVTGGTITVAENVTLTIGGGFTAGGVHLESGALLNATSALDGTFTLTSTVTEVGTQLITAGEGVVLADVVAKVEPGYANKLLALGDDGTIIEIEAAIVIKDSNGVAIGTYTDPTEIHEAINAAEAGQTVALRVTVETTAVVVVPANVTLDLNGQILEAPYFAAFGNVIDTAATAGGLEIAKGAATTMLQENNAYLPLYDTTNGCYKFYAYELKSVGAAESTAKSAKFWFTVDFSNAAAYALLADADAAGLYLTVDVSWTKDEATTTVTTTIPQKAINDWYPLGSEGGVYVGVYGLDKVGEVTVTPILKTSTAVNATCEAMTHNV